MSFDSIESRRTLVILAGIIIVAGLMVYFIMAKNAARNDDVSVLLAPPESAVYTDRSGNPIDLRDLRGVPLIVNAWASWSPYSANELPALALLKQEYGDTIEVIAVNRMEPSATIEAYLATIGSTEGIVFVNDSTDHFFGSVMGYAMPETLFYTDEGELKEHVRGTLTLAQFKEKIDALIQTDK